MTVLHQGTRAKQNVDTSEYGTLRGRAGNLH
jgi:hypothetical protein